MPNKQPARTWNLLIVASFAPFAFKAATYASIGTFLPLLVFSFFGALTWLGLRFGRWAGMLAVRVWASAMILWGALRLGLIVLDHLVGLNEAHVSDQFTVWYIAISLGHVLLGLYLLRNPQSGRDRWER